jgi:hypothetical protein
VSNEARPSRIISGCSDSRSFLSQYHQNQEKI